MNLRALRLSFLQSRGRAKLLRWLGWMAFANSLLLVLFALQYIPANLPLNAFGYVFLGLAFPGHFLLLTLLPALLLSVVALSFPSHRLVFRLGVFINSILVVLIFVDIRVFTLYRFHLNGMVWNLLRGGAATDILIFSWLNWLLAALVIVGIMAGEWLVASWIWGRVVQRPSCCGALVVSLMIAVMVTGQGLHAWANATQRTEVTRLVRYIPWVHALTAKRFLRKHGWLPETTEVAKMGGTPSGEIIYPLRELCCPAQTDPPNILLLVVDGLRFDMLDPQVMPNTWRLSREAWVFQDHNSTGNATRFGIFGLLSGLHGTYWHAMVAEQKGSAFIAELKSQGYRLGIYGSASLHSPEFDRTVFADVQDQLPERTTGKNAHERDAEINRRILNFISQDNNRPFFGFVFYDAPHSYSYPSSLKVPFQPVWENVNYLELDKEFDPEPFRNRYKNSLYYDDILIGKVLALLKSAGTLDNTVLIVTGDHGKEFNETGQNYWGHNGNFSRYQVQVPLIIRWPGSEHRLFTHRTSHLDLVPTLLKDVFHCGNDINDYSNGRHLLDEGDREFVLVSSWSRTAIIQANRITVFEGLGDMDVFDLGYHPLPGSELANDVLLQAMREQSRFFASH